MKLLHCVMCKDTIALTQVLRVCQCKKSKGRYVTMREAQKTTYNAFYSGPAGVVGIQNKELTALDYAIGTGEFYKGDWIYIRPDKTTVLKVKDAAKWNPLKEKAV